MKTAFSRSARSVPVSSQAGSRLSEFPAGRAERAEKAEGKIKEHGTTSGQFSKFLLSAHCLAAARAARHFSAPRAACLRKALALLDFDRHHGREWPIFRGFRPEARP
ncbi:hypothetical protein [Nitratireductor aquibiodomus]|uniref:hypothetical protein n=1 Tax=Nitratireductor aquibiodomus TaxID=204799 RepID=UPI0012DFBD5E|nr:hypothetical protein [Nitratireductor aquibiodomus]